MAEYVIGSGRVEFRGDGHRRVIERSSDGETRTRISDTTEIIEGVAVPTWVEITTSVRAEPDCRVRFELRDGSLRVVELAWISHPHQEEIRQKHYRDLDLTGLAIDVVSGAFWKAPERPEDPRLTYQEQSRRYVEQIRASKRTAAKLVERQRKPPEYRAIADPSVLKEVAEIYRANINDKPRKSVAAHLKVNDRVASTYIGKAREKGLLPPTKQGQKKA